MKIMYPIFKPKVYKLKIVFTFYYKNVGELREFYCFTNI
jgi:hypothetical protein